MSGNIRRAVAGICAAFGMLALSPIAGADPTIVSGGVAQLPSTGLVIDLPARTEGVYHVSGSWALNAKDGVFDSRDIVDEINSAGNVTAGNWALVGYFDAGECDAVLASEKLDASWTTTQDFWGQSWSVRGGVFQFDGALGRRPAAVLCRTEQDGLTLLLYRFLTVASETLDQASVLADVKSSVVLPAISKSFNSKRTGQYIPLGRGDLRNRGTAAAARAVTLPVSKLRIDLPEDGYLWLARAADSSDMLDRMLPAVAVTSFEVMAVDNVKCADILEGLKDGAKVGAEAQNLPAGWLVGPAIIVDGEVEPVVCYPASFGALVVGLVQGGGRDFLPFHPMLGALTRATRVP